MANEVVLRFAGDATSLEKTFDKVGASSKTMAADIVSASGGFDRLGSAADGTTTHMRGTADMADGLGTVLEGMGVKGAGALGSVAALGMGVADLADGIGTTLLPMLKNMGARLAATSVGTWAVNAATSAWTAAQWLLNAALSANPIGIAVVAVGALVGAFVLAWKHSETFRDIVRGALDTVRRGAENLWNFFKDLPGKLMGVGGAVADAVTWPYRTGFNAIARLWNNTVGKLAFEIPDWVPGMGGKGFKMPQLPTFHAGGTVPGPRGTEVPILAMAGERVTPAGAGQTTVIKLVLDGREITEVVHDGLLTKQRRGGTLGFEAA